MAMTPLNLRKKMFGLQSSWYSNRPARTHDFNATIGFKKDAPSPEISPKKRPKLDFQTKPANFDIFWLIFRDLVHIFKRQFLR